ncbi:unnamed protein product [Urochloa humidicola]
MQQGNKAAVEQASGCTRFPLAHATLRAHPTVALLGLHRIYGNVDGAPPRFPWGWDAGCARAVTDRCNPHHPNILKLEAPRTAKPHHHFQVPELFFTLAQLRTTRSEKGEAEMENGGGGAKPTTRFGFSWADEVEREEREQAAMQQQAQQPPPRKEPKKEQIKADPFGAARPREVVLEEKGIDWRARDRELELAAAAARPPRSAARGLRRGAATTAEPAMGRASGVSASACAATPARGVPALDRDAGRTPHPRRQPAAAAAASTPRPPPAQMGRGNAASVGRSARGGSKRKFAGECAVRRARPAGDHAEQGRRVFGELNVGNGCDSSLCDSAAGKACNCNQAANQTEGMKAAAAVAADGAPPTAGTATATRFDESAAGQKRRRGAKRWKGRGSCKAKKQQTQMV